MSDLWYYAQNNQSVGPVSLAALKTILLESPRSESVFVWRAGFPRWIEARNVDQLAMLFMARPKVFAADTTLTLNEVTRPYPKWMKNRRLIGSIISVALAVGISSAVRGLSQSVSTKAAPNPASVISGKTRELFVEGGLAPV